MGAESEKTKLKDSANIKESLFKLGWKLNRSSY